MRHYYRIMIGKSSGVLAAAHKALEYTRLNGKAKVYTVV